MSHPARPGLPPAVSRARWLLMGLFALTGIIFSSWLARIPTVRDLLDLSTGELGLMLLIGSLGALLTVTFAGIVVQRFGSRTSLLLSTAVLAVGYVLMGVGPTAGSVPLLGVGIFLNGVAIALGNVPLNVESARIERAMGRTVIPQFHAAFSIGAVAGSAIGALASHLDISVALQFSVIAARRGRLAARLAAWGGARRRPRRPSALRERPGGTRARRAVSGRSSSPDRQRARLVA